MSLLTPYIDFLSPIASRPSSSNSSIKGNSILALARLILIFCPLLLLSALQLCSSQPHASSAAESLRSSFAPSSPAKRSQPPARAKRRLGICLLSRRGCSFKKPTCPPQQGVLNPGKERSSLKTPPQLSATAEVTTAQNHPGLSHGVSGRGRLNIFVFCVFKGTRSSGQIRAWGQVEITKGNGTTAKEIWNFLREGLRAPWWPHPYPKLNALDSFQILGFESNCPTQAAE